MNKEVHRHREQRIHMPGQHVMYNVKHYSSFSRTYHRHLLFSCHILQREQLVIRLLVSTAVNCSLIFSKIKQRPTKYSYEHKYLPLCAIFILDKSALHSVIMFEIATVYIDNTVEQLQD